MQYTMQVFEYEDRRPFRIIDRNGEHWFVLNDVCRELEIANPSDAATRLDSDEKDVLGITDSIGRPVKTTIINESGLYSLILTSRKEAAKKFKKWVTADVLPSIRRTGGYGLAGTPRFIRRYNANWDRVDNGHFSVISELAVRLWGRLEQVGHIMADKAPDGTELRPDNSVGRCFADWLKKHYPDQADNHSHYLHWTDAGEFPARQYPNSVLPLYIDYVDNVWIPERAEGYFNTRDPAALPHLPKLLPSRKKMAVAAPRKAVGKK